MKYTLLRMHMSCDPDFIFGHAIIAGMLADSSSPLNTYEKYKTACIERGVVYYGEIAYNQFMLETRRKIEQPVVIS